MLPKFILFLLITTSVFSQQEISRFSLKEAVDFALQNNSISKNAARDVEIAKLQKWETTSTGLPQIKAAISYNNWLKQQISLIPAEFFGGSPGQFSEITFGTKQTMNGTVTISQKIFDGSYLVGLQAAKVYLEISENAKEKTEIELRKMVAYTYGNVLLSEENLKIVNSNITLLEKNVRDLTKVYENGLIEQESVQQLQLTLASLKSNQSYVKRLKKIAYQMFNNTLGLDLESSVELTNDLNQLIAMYTSLAPAFQMVFEQRQVRRQNTADTAIDDETIKSIAIFPLSIPLIAGPGAMATSLLLSKESYANLTDAAISYLPILVVIFIATLAMWLSSKLASKLGPTIITVVQKIFGLLLGALAIEFVIEGIRNSFNLV